MRKQFGKSRQSDRVGSDSTERLTVEKEPRNIAKRQMGCDMQKKLVWHITQ